MLSLFSQSDSKPQDRKETSGFDLNSFVGSIAGSTQKNQSSGSKNGVENYLDVSSEKIDRKKFVPVKSGAKPAAKSSNTDDRKSKDQSHSSQSQKNGHTDASRGRDDPRDHRDSDKSKQSSYRGREEKNQDYDPLGRKHEGGNGRSSNAYDDMPIKKKPADGHDGRNGEYSPKIKKVHEPSSPKIKRAEPSSPKIKKAEPSLVKRPEASPAKPRPSQTPPSRPDANKSSTQNSSRPIPRKSDDSIARKPQSGTSQPSSRPTSAKPTSSSPAPSKSSLGSKPATPVGKPSSLSKPMPAKPSSMSQSPRPLGQKPGPSMGSKPVSKPGAAGPRPAGSGVKKDFAAPTPKPGMRPVSQSPKPGQGRPMNGAPAESKEAMKRRMEMKERMQKEAMLKGKKPMPTDGKMMSKPTTNLVKRPPGRPDPRMEPALMKKPKLSASEKKQTLNSIFKGAPTKKKNHYNSEDDDYDDNDSFIDDGDDDADEAMNEFSRMMTGYRKRVMMSKPYEDDIDNMEAGFDRIQAEEEWTKHVGEIEDRREAEFIKKELEEELAANMKRKRKLKI